MIVKMKWEGRNPVSEPVPSKRDLWQLFSLALVLILISMVLPESSLLCDLKIKDSH